MASCTNCTRTLPAGVQVCPFCGKKISATMNHGDPDQTYLFELRKTLNRERNGWRINGLIFVSAAFFLLLAGILAFLSGDLPGTVAYAILLLWCLVGVFLDFRQFHRVEEYIDSVYLDCYPAIDRAEGKGPQVFAGFFGIVPLFSILKNHKSVTANRGTFYRIHREQSQKLDRTFHTDLQHDWE